ncbi:MAG: TadE/TadG family type IV pilus assembly protein [Pseudomonadota bacterium]
MRSQPIKRLMCDFAHDRKGAVAIMFGLMLVIVFGLTGAAIDYGRAVNARQATINALDSAVLAAGRALQVNGGDVSAAIAVAEKFYEQAKSNNLTIDNTTFGLTGDGNAIEGKTAGTVVSPFLAFVGKSQLDIDVTATAILAVDGNAGTNVEVALMLDTTGSMGGTKMVDLKEAAEDLVNIVVWDDQSTYTSRIALVPFADYVNVSDTYFKTVTNKNPKKSGDRTSCVKERDSSTYRYTDVAPGSGKYFARYTGSSDCRPKSDNILVPLTSDKTVLTNAISKLRTEGMTAGHLGINWAWLTLSPKWDTIWPTSSRPAPYSDITTMQTVNVGGQDLEVQKLRKIAVLMTDGYFNRKYLGSNSNTQAKALCDAMKQEGVEVYSVVFGLSQGSSAHQTMSHCATSPDSFYDAQSGADLKAAFRDIALKISILRLSQ